MVSLHARLAFRLATRLTSCTAPRRLPRSLQKCIRLHICVHGTTDVLKSPHMCSRHHKATACQDERYVSYINATQGAADLLKAPQGNKIHPKTSQMCAYIRVCACICACARTGLCTYVCTSLHMCAYVCICARVCAHKSAAMCVYVSVCAPIRHNHTYTERTHML